MASEEALTAEAAPPPENPMDWWKPLTWRSLVWTAVLLITLAGFALRYKDYTRADLTEDEELSTDLPLVSYPGIFTDIAGRPPLAFIFQKIAIDISGENTAAALRIPGILQGTLSIVLMFLWMRMAVGTRAGLIAAALLSFNFFHIYWSRDARYYPLLMLVALVALWGLWRGAVHRKASGWIAFAIALVAAPLTHFSGYLFDAAMLSALPVVALMPYWRNLLWQHRRRAAHAAVGTVAVAAIAAFLLRDSLGTVTKHITWPNLAQPLPPLFDVSPVFLISKLSDVMSLEGWALWALLGLMGIGLVYGILCRFLFSFIFLAVIILPFAAFFLFPPAHAWHPKYFIFMLPVLLGCVALGADAVASVVSLEPWTKLRWGWPRALQLAVGVVVIIPLFAISARPNVERTLKLHAFPDRAMQQLADALEPRLNGGASVYYTWPERDRVLGEYLSEAVWEVKEGESPNMRPRLHHLTLDTAFPSPYGEGHAVSFLLDGKAGTPSPLAAELLSARYTRRAFDESMLCVAPNPEWIAFGETMPGAPDPAGPLVLAAGEQKIISVPPAYHLKRSDTFIADVESLVAEGQPHLYVLTPGGKVCLLQSKSPGRHTYIQPVESLWGKALWEPVMAPLEVKNVSLEPIWIHSLAWLPTLKPEETLHFEADDFLSITGLEGLETIWPDELLPWEGKVNEPTMLIRDMRRGHAATYRFYNEQETRVVVRLTALNDPPYSNRYQLHIPTTKLHYQVVEFPLADGNITTQESGAFTLSPGVHDLSVGFLGMTREEYMTATRNGRVTTEEALQNPGIARVEIVCVE